MEYHIKYDEVLQLGRLYRSESGAEDYLVATFYPYVWSPGQWRFIMDSDTPPITIKNRDMRVAVSEFLNRLGVRAESVLEG